MKNETADDAARRLAAEQLKKGFVFIALHTYHDKNNHPLYWRIRLKHPQTQEKWIRPLYSKPEQGFVLEEPVSNDKPLYNLPALLERTSDTVWITEGELCADKLSALGLLATTSGSVVSMSKTDWSPLANRKVIIWRDYDDAGLRYANQLTETLQSLNCEVKWVDVETLHLPAKGDCVDWLHINVAATQADIEALPLITPTLETRIVDQSNTKAEKTNNTAERHFLVNDSGVYHVDEDEKRWICSPLEIQALVRDQGSENWGRLLAFRDADQHLHTWAMPMEMLRGSGEELRGELLRQGLHISYGRKARELLTDYITSSEPKLRACCVGKTGWYQQVFVLPDQTIGTSSEMVLFQSERKACDYQQAGTLADWQQSIATYCRGNSRLMFAIACAFAAMLLYHSGAESGGLHFVGESSTGKTTALKVAASVFGATSYVNRWRSTVNGLEALAVTRSDTLLVLDELAQVDPREAGEIAYMLANGSGKNRASKTGHTRSRHEWRLLFLSAGEIGLAQHLQDAGKKVQAGQTVRLVDIPVDAEKGYGLFETLHHFPSGKALSDALCAATTYCYGTAAITFLQKITQPAIIINLPSILTELAQQFIHVALPANASSQVERVCHRFALIAAAGELATHHGITGWEDGEVIRAVKVCFDAWLQQRGSIENQETVTALAQIRSFFERHGESRFTDWDAPNLSRTINRAGFKRVVRHDRLMDGTESTITKYYVLPEAFRQEICAGLNYRTVTRALLEAGWLEPDNQGLSYRRECLPDLGRSRCYVFNTSKMWES